MMEKLLLINWRSHKNSALEFRAGTNLMVGIMGAGKSSVLEAISFAFFGTFPALERRKMKIEEIVRLNENSAQIELEFLWGSSKHTIKRRIEKTKKGANTTAEIFRNGSLIESGQIAVSEYVERLLGINYDLFSRAIYAEQNNIDYFLNIDPRRRKQEIDGLLGLDKFELARANLVTVIGKISTKKKTLESQFNKTKLIEHITKQNQIQKELNTTENTNQKAAYEIELQGKKVAELGNKYETLRKEKEKYENLNREKMVLNAKLETLRANTVEVQVQEKDREITFQRLKQCLEEREKGTTDCKGLEEILLKYTKESGALDARIKNAVEASRKKELLAKELEKILAGMSLEQIGEEHKKNQSELVTIESELKTVEREITELEEWVTQLKPGLRICPLCEAELDEKNASHLKEEKKKRIWEKGNRKKNLENDKAEKRNMFEELTAKAKKASLYQEKINLLTNEYEGVGGFLEQKNTLDREVGKIKKIKEENTAKLEKLAEEIEKIKQRIKEYESVIKTKNELEKAMRRIGEIDSLLKKIQFTSDEDYEIIRKNHEQTKLDMEKLLFKRNILEEKIKNLKNMEKIIGQEIMFMKGIEEEFLYLTKLEEELMIYKNALIEAQIGLRTNLIDAINRAMGGIWPIIYPYENYRNLRLSISDRDYIFEIDDGSSWRTLESFASGGERASAALALRIALAMVLTPKISLLVLDEPTHNLDAETVELLSSSLQFKVPEVVKQTFVITHDEGLIGSEFARSYRFTRDKKTNSETMIEKI